jgi:23S rRNA pseudouridine955/2504/2580 synthase
VILTIFQLLATQIMHGESVVRFLKVDAEYAGQRIDNFLRSRYKSLPKSRLYRIIRKGEVRVNKKRVDPDYRIQADDEIRLPPVRDQQALPQIKVIDPDFERVLTQRVLYEDKYFFILNKPAGMAVHAGSGVRLGVIEALRLLHPQEKYIELAYRLDRATSGCLLIVKRPSILKLCHALLRENKMDKRYVLLVKGRWPANLRTVDSPLEGKPSVTHFKILKYYKETTLLEAALETGRNHQIRLHASQKGFPLAGDDKYGDREFNKRMKAYGCHRLFLHAAKSSFQLEDKTFNVEAPLDEDLKNCLERLESLEK